MMAIIESFWLGVGNIAAIIGILMLGTVLCMTLDAVTEYYRIQKAKRK